MTIHTGFAPRPYPCPEATLQAEMRQWNDIALAARHGVPVSTIARWRHRWGIPARVGLRKGRGTTRQEQLVALLAGHPEGLSCQVLADQMGGVTRQAIGESLQRLARKGVVLKHPHTGHYCLGRRAEEE